MPHDEPHGARLDHHPHHGFGEGQCSIHSAVRGQSPNRCVNGDPVPPPLAWGLRTSAGGAGGAVPVPPPLAGGRRTSAGGGGGAVPPGGGVEGSAVPATSTSSVVTQVPNLARDLSPSCVRLLAKRAARFRQDAEGSAAAASNPQDATPRMTQTEQALRRIAVHIRHLLLLRPRPIATFRAPRAFPVASERRGDPSWRSPGDGYGEGGEHPCCGKYKYSATSRFAPLDAVSAL